MEIAIIAHDKKKELMAQFCIAYYNILKNHSLCATAITGKYISDATGLKIEKMLMGDYGGEQQMASRISYNEIDCLLYFRDTTSVESYDEDAINILRLCDVHNIPVATNIATAEILICAVERGDLDWRNYVNPIYNKNREHKDNRENGEKTVKHQ
ncbi:MAG: methylglyoxal synthase [Oscillospiraceae bacterium]|nr:methylglyoxal synthase [Oscillospiraceae bacterium]